MSSNSIIASKHDPAGLAGIIVSKSVANLRSTSPNQIQRATKRPDRQNQIATATYYRAAQRGFDGGCEIQDWLEAEMEINGE